MNTDIAIQSISLSIASVRGTRVILDSDLAKLYGVETKRFNEAIKRNAARFPDDFIIMVMDGPSSHTTKELKKRDHLVPLILPPYSPELNPVEIIWDSLREGWFTNRVFESLDAVRKQVVIAMEAFADDDRAVSRLTAWPWIMQAIVSS